MFALVFVGTLGVVPLVAWLLKWFGKDPGSAYTAYFIGALLGWAGMALLLQ